MAGTGVAGGTALASGSAVAAGASVAKHSPVPPRAAPVHAPAKPAPRVHAGPTPRALGPSPHLAPRSSVHATFVVDTNTDPASGTSCAPGHTAGTCSLRAAIAAADNDAGHIDAVSIPSGMTVTLTQGTLFVTNSMFIDGSGATVNGGGRSEIFDVYGDPAVQITGLKITGGYETYDGGGLYCSNGALVLSNVDITGNVAGSGGGLYSNYYCDLWIDNSKIQSNIATGYEGQPPASAPAPVTANGSGGGLYVDGSAYIARTLIGGHRASGGNDAASGAGLYNAGNTSVVDSHVDWNTSSTAVGDGVGIYNDDVISVSGSTMDHNTAPMGADGVGFNNEDVAHIANSSASSNSAVQTASSNTAYGTGIYGDGDVLTLSNVTIAHSTSSSTSGGEVYGGALLSYDNQFSYASGSISSTTNGISSSDDYISGGAAYLDGSHATLNGVSISGTSNNAGTDEGVEGGAVYINEYTTFERSSISKTSNTGYYVDGGALYNDDYTTIGNVTVKSTTNTASYTGGGEIYGGAIYNDGDYMAIANMTVDGTSNAASVASASAPTTTSSYVYGGAFYNEYDVTATNLSITHTTTSASSGDGYVEGGALYNDDYLVLKDSQIVGFSVKADSYLYGGAVYSDEYINASNVTVGNGVVTIRGGVDAGTPYADGTILYAAGTLTNLANTTLANISSTTPSTASYLYGIDLTSGDPAQFTNDTIANDSVSGPASNRYLLWSASGSSVALRNSIVASTTPALNCAASSSGILSSGHNIDNGHSCGFTAPGDMQNTYPKVLPLADNGGPIWTAALKPAFGSVAGSPAIDAGTNVACPPTDARGVTRPQGKNCDIGAYELASHGYWLTTDLGKVRHYGAGGSYGSLSTGKSLGGPIIAIVPTSDHKGYWLVGSDGGVFSFGDAKFHGSLGGITLAYPIVAAAATADGGGYWLVSSKGQVFSFGDALNYGQVRKRTYTSAIVAIAGTRDGKGYWLAATGGKVYPYGDAKSYGNSPHTGVVSIATTGDGKGYWLATASGAVFHGGDAKGYGSGSHLSSPVVAIVATPDSMGYWLVTAAGRVLHLGDAKSLGSSPAAVTDGASANY